MKARDRAVIFRVDAKEQKLIERAAAKSKERSVSDFVRKAALSKAEEVIK